MTTKSCKRCGSPVPIARVLSLCDTCIQQATSEALYCPSCGVHREPCFDPGQCPEPQRQAMKDTARGIN